MTFAFGGAARTQLTYRAQESYALKPTVPHMISRTSSRTEDSTDPTSSPRRERPRGSFATVPASSVHQPPSCSDDDDWEFALIGSPDGCRRANGTVRGSIEPDVAPDSALRRAGGPVERGRRPA